MYKEFVSDFLSDSSDIDNNIKEYVVKQKIIDSAAHRDRKTRQ